MGVPERATDVSVCIVSYNGVNHVRECLASAFEVIVVDNASQDGTVETVRTEFPQVTLIANSENRYFTRANNQALRQAQGRYCLILNPDTLLQPDTLRRVVGFLDDHPEVGAATCLQRHPDGRVLMVGARFYTVFQLLCIGKFFSRFVRSSGMCCAHSVAEWDRQSTRRVDVAEDSFLMVRREALEVVGGYDEQFLLYFTEDDLCRRLWAAGWPVYYYAGTSIVHKVSRSTRPDKFPLYIYCINRRDAVTYFRIHHGRCAALVAYIILSLDLIGLRAMGLTKRLYCP